MSQNEILSNIDVQHNTVSLYKRGHLHKLQFGSDNQELASVKVKFAERAEVKLAGRVILFRDRFKGNNLIQGKETNHILIEDNGDTRTIQKLDGMFNWKEMSIVMNGIICIWENNRNNNKLWL